MKALGAVQQVISAAAEKVAEALSSLLNWILQTLTAAIKWVIDQIIALYENAALQYFNLILSFPFISLEQSADAFWRILLFSGFGVALLAGFIGLTVFLTQTSTGMYLGRLHSESLPCGSGPAGAALVRGWGIVDAAVAQFFVATWGLIILSMKSVASQRISDIQTRLLVNAVLSAGAFSLAWFTNRCAYNPGVHKHYGLFFPVATTFSIFGKGT